MIFLKLICVNLTRHRTRSLVGVAGIAFGVAAMLTVLSIIMGAINMFEKILSNESHYLVFEKNVSDLFFSSIDTEVVDGIRSMPMVQAAHPILFGIVSSEGHPVITCFGLESSDPRLKNAEWLAGTAEQFGSEPGTVFLGSRAAEFLEANYGGKVDIGKEQFTVGGIIKTDNGFEDGGVFMPLEEAQRFFHREGYSSIVTVTLNDDAQEEAFRKYVEENFTGFTALQNEEFRQSYSQFRILSATSWAVGTCAFVLGGLGVANTMIMSVFTRIREIAILLVNGFSRKQVATLILGEAAALASLGTLVGFIVGLSLLKTLEHVPQLQGYIQVLLSPGIIYGIILVAFVTSFLGSIYPAWFASRIQPAEALRYE